MIRYPTIPDRIVIHLGAPSANAQNVTETFSDYIKNVASSEIYPTWPREAILANVYAEISVALNRVYTEYYRSAGRNFDITSSPAFDQNYIYGREIFANISELVDGVFNRYLKRPEFIEPLYAVFCDGVNVSCGGLSQWGSVELAKRGLSAFSILKNYYGDSLTLVENVPIDSIPESAPPVALREGDTGNDVESMQIKLNRISASFPGIPKITPADGFFDTGTTEAVKVFQSIFGLTEDGTVGRATWYRIQNVYNGVKRLATLNSEGIRVQDFPTQYTTPTLEVGINSSGVLTLQYYLSYIALFVGTVPSCRIDGAFGPETRASVEGYQRTYALPVTGAVDRTVWNSIQNTYYGILSSIDYQFSEGNVLPFPGRVLRVGIEGEDVRALQEYLNYVGRTYSSIPRVTVDGDFGNETARAVRAFKTTLALPGNPERVSAQDWYALTTLYQDLYFGNNVRDGQFPGYIIR